MYQVLAPLIDSKATLQYYGIRKARDMIFGLFFVSNNQIQGDTLHLILHLRGGGDSSIQVTIPMPNGSTERLYAKHDGPVSMLKKVIFEQTGISVAMQFFIYLSKEPLCLCLRQACLTCKLISK